jgi:hypothetical protein
MQTLVRRWPTALGILVAALTAYGLSEGAELAPILALSGLIYLGAAALERQSAAWPIFAVTFVILTVVKVLDLPGATWVFLGVAAVFIAYGLIRGITRPPGGFPLQAVAMVVLGVIAAVTVLAGGTLGAVLVALGLYAHAGWDAYHHRTNRVVARSMAEFCLVLDVLIATVMLVVAFTS